MESFIKVNSEGMPLHFHFIENGVFLLTFPKGIEYVGITGTADNIIAIDPSGGPFLEVGGKLWDHVQRIYTIKSIKGYGRYYLLEVERESVTVSPSFPPELIDVLVGVKNNINEFLKQYNNGKNINP
jgi:hypothetical protein